MKNKKMLKSEHEHHGESHEQEKTEAFQEQQVIMDKIKEVGFAKYAEHLPNLAKAFDLEAHKPQEQLHKCVCCMDERTNFGIHAAGSGILLSDADFEKYFAEAQPDSISSHTGCGAAKLYCKKMGIEGDPDAVAREWAQRKAKEKGIAHVHLEVEKPFHYARVCYYDSTGRFNFDGVEGLPAGFVVGRKFMDKDACLAEVGVAKDIIFGDHGFGENLLDKDNPFLLVAIAETQEQLNELKNELEEKAKSMGGNVVVDGFLAPKAPMDRR
jgi:hypothetical protein